MKFGLVVNTRKSLFWSELPRLLSWFEKCKIPLILSREILQAADLPENIQQFPSVGFSELPDACDVVLAFGGDGTILRTVKAIGPRETPVLGINVGGLGFLTEIPLDHFTEELDRIAGGEYNIEKRLMLEGSIDGQDESLFALNEISIDKGNAVRVIQIELSVDGTLLNNFIADGLLVSTPTGSTAYSLACGGPIVVPSTDVLIINPICPHSLTNRPVIVPAGVKITITVRTEATAFVVGADGRDVRHCENRTQISVKKAPFHACLMKSLHSNYFNVLHTKLNWGEDFRDKNRWSYDS